MTQIRLVFQRPFLGHNILLLCIAGLLGLALTQLSPWITLGVLGATAVLLLILRYPIAGLGIALLAGPFGALESLFLGYSPLDSGQSFLLLTFAVWFLRGLYHKRIVIPRAAVHPTLLLFIWIAFLSVLDAPSSVFGIRELIKWGEIALIIVLVLSEAEQFNGRFSTYLVLVTTIILFSGFVQALIGIWQFGLRGIGPEHFVISGNFYRAYGSFEQPNPFGGLMHMTALLAIGVTTAVLPPLWRSLKAMMWEWRWQPPKITPFYLFVLVCAGTAVLSLLFSWSRGAWLGFSAGAAALGLFWPRQRWIGVVALVVGGTLFVAGLQTGFLPASVSDRLLGFVADFQLGDVRGVDINDSNYSVLERLAHWQSAVDMARDQLWLGVGFGNYETAYANYALINWPDPLGHAHNYYLNVLAEVGVLGLSAYLLFWGTVVWQTVRQINIQSGLNRGIVLGLMGCWVAISVHHLVDKLYVNNLYIQLGAMLGLLQLIRTRTETLSLS